MGKTLTEKVLEQHLVEGTLEKGTDIAIKIDQTLTQDATGTIAYLQFEAMGLDRVQTELSVSYVDHNTLQTDFKNPDDHRYLQSIATRYGLYFSRPGNGICHQLHLERFSRPGKTLLGSDSHTPTGGGVGMIAIGAGGLDVAAAMAGESFRLRMPKVVKVYLTGQLQDFVSAKDVILEVLRRIGVKGAVNKVLEYTGPGIKTLSVPERGTITNMGTETGATTSIFPSDEITKQFLEAQERGDQWIALEPDKDAVYDEIIEINLNELEPLIAEPHSPGNVKTVKELEGLKVDQVCIGSCTNSSLRDLKIAANMLKGKTINNNTVLTVSPGSRQVVDHMIHSGEMAYLVEAGARILENACGPCIGMGLAPKTDAVSLRTFNRNFLGRTGTKNAKAYLVSPETAAMAAIEGIITDPRKFGKFPQIDMPMKFMVNDNMIIPPIPPEEAKKVEIVRGPNIKPLPEFNPIPKKLEGELLLKVGDDVTASLEKGGGFIVGGDNYGQGSSREHAAIAPKYLGIKAVIVKSFARIHLANLINFGIVPLTFVNKEDYDKTGKGDHFEIDLTTLETGRVSLKNLTKNIEIPLTHSLSQTEIEELKAGGKLTLIKQKHAN